jgi:hypothetical protein
MLEINHHWHTKRIQSVKPNDLAPGSAFRICCVSCGRSLCVSYLLGQRHSESATGETYEGGIVPKAPRAFDFFAPYYCSRCSSSFLISKPYFCLRGRPRVRELGWTRLLRSSGVHWRAGRCISVSVEMRRVGLGRTKEEA